MTGTTKTRTTKTAPLRFGLQLTSVHAADDSPELQLGEHEELVTLVERHGFDFIGVGQHYLTPELRYYQPVPYLAHLGQVGKSLRLATFILLLPLHNPVDVAEQVATLDVVSGGRAIMGVGLGYADHEFAAFGVDRAQRVGRFEESLGVIGALWEGTAERWEGRHFHIDPLATGVRPVQKPGPPVWAAGQTERAVRRAARLADAWCVPPFVTHDELVQLMGAFRDERRRVGRPEATEYPVRREMVIADTMEEAVRGAAARSTARMDTYVRWGMAADYQAESLTGVDVDTLRGRFVLGTPDDCAEQLAELRQATGMTHFTIKPQWPGLPHEAAVEQVERFATEVVPRLGS